jgi:hypothetical protein
VICLNFERTRENATTSQNNTEIKQEMARSYQLYEQNSQEREPVTRKQRNDTKIVIACGDQKFIEELSWIESKGSKQRKVRIRNQMEGKTLRDSTETRINSKKSTETPKMNLFNLEFFW